MLSRRHRDSVISVHFAPRTVQSVRRVLSFRLKSERDAATQRSRCQFVTEGLWPAPEGDCLQKCRCAFCTGVTPCGAQRRYTSTLGTRRRRLQDRVRTVPGTKYTEPLLTSFDNTIKSPPKTGGKLSQEIMQEYSTASARYTSCVYSYTFFSPLYLVVLSGSVRQLEWQCVAMAMVPWHPVAWPLSCCGVATPVSFAMHLFDPLGVRSYRESCAGSAVV